MSTRIGYTLSSEEHGPSALVTNAARAEAAGFDFLTISDHYHPWIQEQGHSPFVWSVLGAVSTVTQSVPVAVGVTCPIVRIHPAVVAQAAATTSLLFDGRFSLGIGTGEALNEHILGDRWPTPEVRREMLEEAIGIMRALWTGETVDYHGTYYTVENARLFDPPAAPLPLIVSAFGDDAVELAGRVGEGFWGHDTDPATIEAFRAAGGRGPRYAQLNVCWAESADEARQTVHRVWPNGSIPGQLSQDLPTWTHFEQAVELVDQDAASSSVPSGPDIVEAVLDSVRDYVRAGYDHLHLHQIGHEQAGFLDYARRELLPALRDVRTQDAA